MTHISQKLSLSYRKGSTGIYLDNGDYKIEINYLFKN